MTEPFYNDAFDWRIVHTEKKEMTRYNNRCAHDAVSLGPFNALTFCMTFREFYLFGWKPSCDVNAINILLDLFMPMVIKSLYENVKDAQGVVKETKHDFIIKPTLCTLLKIKMQ